VSKYSEDSIHPQKGFQEDFLSSTADIVIGGAMAGVGKSYALLLEAGRYTGVEGYMGIVFRRTYPELKEGGLWDASHDVYYYLSGSPNQTDLVWKFPEGGKIKFSHLQHETSKISHQGKEYAFIGFDELTHFTESQFFYLLSRNRTTCGVKPYIRATCNPDPISWVARFISWWIGDDGFPIAERNGKIRFFIRDGEAFVWGDSKAEVARKVPHIVESVKAKGLRIGDMIKSVSFIVGKLQDNKKLLDKDPSYVGNLMNQPEEERMRLLDGNWKVSSDGSAVYQFEKIEDLETNDFIPLRGKRTMTADIALHGSDKFVMLAFVGNVLTDGQMIDKSDGREVLDYIDTFRRKNRVSRSNVCYDSDGVGGFLGGWLTNSIAFKNGGRPRQIKNDPAEYFNLKTQCFYKSGDKVNRGEYFVHPDVPEDIRSALRRELRYIKRDKMESDGKLRIQPKDMVKNALGHSPDIADAFMMHAYFDLVGDWH
jgi:hypothetical protein